ncbi:GNAT family N-acetyltransferase [Actinomadura darangshiensis]|uniref:GNAT family N-acetyltransferase n=1 Tax=Actinomadura darangshiensis TaxID=705336 RepID=A0A4R5B8M3_9ACTN|nr:GNAT family N-acetyltransferase [Actinomadura darangshiensis]TDD82341.1 GNAT family N-acetyltransferase [Actinomadura darangshiensis]
MGWTLTDDREEFLARAGGFLRKDPVANTVVLTVTEAMREQGPGLYLEVLFGWWTAGGDVEGTFMWTGGAYPLLLSAVPEPAVPELADALAGRDAKPLGVNGAPAAAAEFARAWARRSGSPSRLVRRERLHRLARLEPPDPAPAGTARVAGAGDRDLVMEWFTAFHRDAGGEGAPNPALVDGRLARGGLTLWEDGGRPVSMAGRTPAVAGVARVAPVYTPSGHRRRGYAAAATAAVTQAALDAGAADVVLFTDVANPTSNGVYRRLGYRPVEDQVVLAFI